jgi:hypothetical protein
VGQLERQRACNRHVFVLVLPYPSSPIPRFLSELPHPGHTLEHSTHSLHVGLNVFLVCIPIAWVAHFNEWTSGRIFARM